MNYIIGDLHGDFRDIKNAVKKYKMTKKDRLFICGDFGFIWALEDTLEIIKETQIIDKISNLEPEILFIDGNHENFDRLLQFSEVNLYGGKVGKIRDNIFHLKRGYVYTIDGKKIFTMGGGISIDRDDRIEGISWWSQEIASKEEEDRAIENLDKVNWGVDYVITHSAPLQAESMVANAMKYMGWYGTFKLNTLYDEGKFLTEVYDCLKFKEWHFGHYHQDLIEGQFHLHYEIVRKFFDSNLEA